MMNQSNKSRGICFNKNALNIQQPIQLQSYQPTNNHESHLDNLKAAALSLENPQQPPTIVAADPDPIKKLQLNINKRNLTHVSDENAQLLPSQQLFASMKDLNNEKQQTNKDKLKPHKQQSKQITTDENAGTTRPDSPNEPSPPKLRSHARNSMRLNLPSVTNQQQQQQMRPPSAALSNNVKPSMENLIDLDLDLDIKQEPVKANQQQVPESLISRIPRLSLKLPLALLPQNRNLAGSKPKLSSLKENKREQQVVPMVTVDEQQEELKRVEEIEDIDKSTSRDAMFLVCDIAQDIYDYMYKLEEEQSIRKDYLREQKIFTPNVRQRLVNWCIEINSKLNLLPETLYMTISVIDRFFDKVQVKQQSQVQLVAAGATLIASKYEEIYPPDVNDLVHLTQNACSRREIIKVEIYILEQLNFNLGKPIPAAFLRRFSRAAHCDQKMHSIAKYLMELSLYEYECSHWAPSLVAAAALFVSLHINGPLTSSTSFSSSVNRSSKQPRSVTPPVKFDRWTQALVHYTRYTRDQLKGPAAFLAKTLKKSQKNPQLYAYCIKKHQTNLNKWTELKSIRVDELIKEQQ